MIIMNTKTRIERISKLLQVTPDVFVDFVVTEEAVGHKDCGNRQNRVDLQTVLMIIQS